MTRSTLAVLVLGVVLIASGVALVYPPAALIVTGIACLAYGLTRNVPDTTEESR